MALVLLQQAVQLAHVHVALERMLQGRVLPFGDGDVDGGGAAELDVGACGIEVRVADEDLARAAQVAIDDAFRGAALVRGEDVRHAGEVPHFPLHALPAPRTGIGLIALHHARPLPGAHGAGAAIGHEVDHHIVRSQQERIVVGVLQVLRALRFGAHADGLHALDAEGLDDGLVLHVVDFRTNHGWTRMDADNAVEAPGLRHQRVPFVVKL